MCTGTVASGALNLLVLLPVGGHQSFYFKAHYYVVLRLYGPAAVVNVKITSPNNITTVRDMAYIQYTFIDHRNRDDDTYCTRTVLYEYPPPPESK